MTTWEDVRRALASRGPTRVADAVSSRAAVAVILRDGQAGIQVLFILRAEHPDDPWSGQMAFPGGRAEPGETDLGATAVREVVEETGVDLTRDADALGSLDEIRAMARGRPVDLAITPYVFRLKGPAEVKPNDEVRSVHWIPLDELLGSRHRSTFDYVHEGTTVRLPCLRVDERVIWGLTYRMFSNLEALLVQAALGGEGRVADGPVAPAR